MTEISGSMIERRSSAGIYAATWIALYFALPDFPPKTKGISYFQMVRAVFCVRRDIPLKFQMNSSGAY